MSRKKTEPDVDGGPSDPSHLTVAVNRRIRVSGHPYNSPSLCIRSSLFSHPSPTRFSSLALSVVSHHAFSKDFQDQEEVGEEAKAESPNSALDSYAYR